MPVVVLPLPLADRDRAFRRWMPRLFEFGMVLRRMLKDRRYFYLRQGRCFDRLREDFPLPHQVEIETLSRCNSTCGFCPVNRFSDPRSLQRMPEDLFHKIIDDLASHHFAGTLRLYSNNEPFLDKRIFDFAAYARRQLPDAQIVIFTNGLPLDIARAERILPNLDGMRINNYSATGELHPNVTEIVRHLDGNRPDLAGKVSVQQRRLSEFKSSRAGNAPNRQRFVGTYRSRCAYPFFQMVVRPDGKLSLCCNDALGQETLGDLSAQTVREAWTDNRRSTVQNLMLKGRDKLDICRHCDNDFVAKPKRVASRDFD
jgi:radical SAM protein with 4Fe4S-binding SPASM domain